MEERVIDSLKKVGLPDRQQKLLAMFPGLLFGFPPPNFDEMMKRFDCPTCQAILVVKEKQSVIVSRLKEQINEYCRPIKERNDVFKKKFEFRRRIPIFGRFVKKPRYEHYYNYTIQTWYLKGEHDWKELQEMCAILYKQDDPHWYYRDGNVEISNEFVDAYLGKDRHWNINCTFNLAPRE